MATHRKPGFDPSDFDRSDKLSGPFSIPREQGFCHPPRLQPLEDWHKAKSLP
jgi:hypothetical protein